MTNTGIKLIAMDMDGTLLNDARHVSQKNMDALQEAARQGITLAICSGRAPGDLSLFALESGLPQCYILSLNGAYCLDAPLGQPFAQHVFQDSALGACLQILSEYDIAYACFQQNRIIVMQPFERVRKKYWTSHREGPGAPECLYGPEMLAEVRALGVCKVVYVEDQDMNRLSQVRERLLKVDGVDVTASAEDNLELMPRGVCKGSAVRELAEALGLTAENVMTFGDYDNDISMIEYAAHGTAMGNATAAIKRAAKHITATNVEDGVALAIEKYALH